jgi:hypothetical protein
MNSVTTKPMSNKQRSKDAQETDAFDRKMKDSRFWSDEWYYARCRFNYGQAMTCLNLACESRNPTFARVWIMRFTNDRKSYIQAVKNLKEHPKKIMPLPN